VEYLFVKIGDGINPSGLVNFIKDVGVRPEKHTLDRIDPYGNYEMNNCRWADKRTQQNNFRAESNSSTGVLGVVKSALNKFEARLTLKGVSVCINRYDTIEEAILARKEAISWKMDYGDDKALEMVNANIKRLENGKRPYGRKTSKYLGVSYDEFRNKWRATLSYREKDGSLSSKNLGRFDTEDLAHNAIVSYLRRKGET